MPFDAASGSGLFGFRFATGADGGAGFGSVFTVSGFWFGDEAIAWSQGDGTDGGNSEAAYSATVTAPEDFSAVPEPGTLLLVGTGLLCLARCSRKRG